MVACGDVFDGIEFELMYGSGGADDDSDVIRVGRTNDYTAGSGMGCRRAGVVCGVVGVLIEGAW